MPRKTFPAEIGGRVQASVRLLSSLCCFMWIGTERLFPCCAHPRAGNFGNLATEKWSEILAGHKRRDFVEELRSDRDSTSVCAKCEFGSQSDLREYEVPGQSYAYPGL